MPSTTNQPFVVVVKDKHCCTLYYVVTVLKTSAVHCTKLQQKNKKMKAEKVKYPN